ncbi:C40 family peptidase [Paenibacillus sp. S28]|uniref:C40 family peptidase n=1 Tax=Paenibacillus sp. S28 TaxID=2767463 RepID=UPI00190CF5DA|nr:C40 family peptidase [Paenibacillus sp. S28]MBJ9992364.1 C40 family peptidase [Paenibacillus sp. S28]
MGQSDIEALLKYAKQFLGVKYIRKSASYHKSAGFDCSSLTQHIFKKFGVELARRARDQAKQGMPVAVNYIQRGDLLFFAVPERFKTDDIPGHVGLYIGNNEMLHCIPYPKNKVFISSLNKPHWRKNFLFARRMINILDSKSGKFTCFGPNTGADQRTSDIKPKYERKCSKPSPFQF